LPVREIGEVIFADGFRQPVAPKSDEGGSFAGVRVQALPFFQRRVIRQRDGKKFAAEGKWRLNSLMKTFFDIPVYRIPQEKYESEQNSFIQHEMSEGGEIVQEMYRREPEQKTRMEQHLWKTYGGCWRFNEIIGFIRLHFFFTQIRGEYWRVTAKKIVRTRKKCFAFLDLKVTYEEEIPPGSTNAEVFALIQKYLARAQNERYVRKFFIDTSVFENIGPFVDWNGLRQSDSRQTVQTCQRHETV